MVAIVAVIEPHGPARPGHTHDDHVARVGMTLAWECSSCGRIEVTDVDLRSFASK